MRENNLIVSVSWYKTPGARHLLQTILRIQRSKKRVEMKLLLLVTTLAALCITSTYGRVVCFADSSFSRTTELVSFNITFVEGALPKCDQLIYGHTGINDDGEELKFFDTNFHANFKYLIEARRKLNIPELKIILSIGGNADPDKEQHKYLKVIATNSARKNFIKSILRVLSDYEFDGIDLAWQFPTKFERILLQSYENLVGIHKIYKMFYDNKQTINRESFTALVKELHSSLQARNKSLTLTVLPHVNTKAYYDVKALAPYVDAVHLMAFDFYTPKRNPTKPSYPAPVYEVPGKDKEKNVDFILRDWLDRGMPKRKIVLGIPTFGRTWKLKQKIEKNQPFDVSELLVQGPGPKGPFSQTRGLLSYGEICLLFNSDLPRISRLEKVHSPSTNNGASAYSFYNSTTRATSIWTGYDEPATVAPKTYYAFVARGIFNYAIFDLVNDDFRGLCNGLKFPILESAFHFVE